MSARIEAAIVVDVEATCWEPDDDPALAADQRNECEIIEIGAVRFPSAGEPFRRVVRPRRHPRLSRFCTALTGLTQADVDGGLPFAEAYADFLAWIGEPEGLVASWGSFDPRQFARDCRRAELPAPTWHALNLKPWFARIARARGAPNRGWMSLAGALQYAGLDFEGTPHRATADAHNTARLVAWGNRLLEP